jgi:hypothetical protein
MIGPCHHDDVLRLNARIHRLFDLLAHICLTKYSFRPVIFPSCGETPDIGAKAIGTHVIGFYAACLLHDTFPECVMSVLSAFFVQLFVDISLCIDSALLPICILDLAVVLRKECS